MSRRIHQDDKPIARHHFKEMRKVWSPQASYWITVWRHGHSYNRMMAIYMLAVMGITRADIEHYTPGAIQ